MDVLISCKLMNRKREYSDKSEPVKLFGSAIKNEVNRESNLNNTQFVSGDRKLTVETYKLFMN